MRNKNKKLVMLVSAWFSAVTVIADENPAILKMSDAIRGKYVTYTDGFEDEARRQAFESYSKACEEWKSKTTEELIPRSLFLSLDCGEPKLSSIGSKEWRGIQVESSGNVTVSFKKDNLLVNEVVVGDMIQEQINAKVFSEKSYDKRCEEWKEKLTNTFRKELLFISCGVNKVTEKLNPIGNGNPRVSGYQTQSSGSLILVRQGIVRERNEYITAKSKGTVSTYSVDLTYVGGAEVFSGYKEANESFYTRCKSWKEKITQEMGSRLLFVTCQKKRSAESITSGRGHTWRQIQQITVLGGIWYYE